MRCLYAASVVWFQKRTPGGATELFPDILIFLLIYVISNQENGVFARFFGGYGKLEFASFELENSFSTYSIN